jgi:rhamnogalacturonan endolyase
MRAITLLFVLPLSTAAAGEAFVPIPAGSFVSGKITVRLDAFEMLAHPVTNAEYAEFVLAAKHPPPPYWTGGVVPKGLENHPVIFVNRYDAGAYLRWRTKRDGRICRLPTAAEFEYAARAGDGGALYPWGGGEPAGHANYDAGDGRDFAAWRKHLEPVRARKPNAWGLYGMAGNVWQMLHTDLDQETMRWVHRLTLPEHKQGSVAGGSWARGAYHLRCAVRGSISAGIRHPDLGFRIVREAPGTRHFQRLPRRVAAVPAGEGRVLVSWQLLPQDSTGAPFHVYRSTRRDATGERLTDAPVTGSTDFLDTGAPPDTRLFYRVRAAMDGGLEGPPSEWAAIGPGAGTPGLVARFAPTVRTGGFTPMFGDLDGDGVLDLAARLHNGIREMSRDPGVPIELEAYTSFGRALWRRPLGSHELSYGNPNNLPVVVYDLDRDGKAEVIARLQEGETLYLAVLDGMTGRVLRKRRWREMATDISGTSTRVHMSIAYLDGKSPAIVTQTGLYENEIIDAYSAALVPLWTWRSFAETNGSGSHHIDIADVDGDGRDEVFNGTMLLNPDGKLRWAIYRLHPDIVAIKRILPGAKDRQVYFAVESSLHAGAYLVDAKTGKIHWKVNREDDPRWTHAHIGWAADIWDGSPGMEMLTNRDGHDAKDQVLFAAEGRVIANPFPPGWRPVNWTGGVVRDLMSTDGSRIGRFTGAGVETQPVRAPNPAPRGSCVMTADLIGDFRDEVVCINTGEGGGQTIDVYANTAPAGRREVTRTASREYRLWLARNMGGGYASYFEWEP